jgi:hypothetical protein
MPDAQADAALFADDPHEVVFVPEFAQPDPHELDAPVVKTAPPKGGLRQRLQLGGNNAVEGLGKTASIRARRGSPRVSDS